MGWLNIQSAPTQEIAERLYDLAVESGDSIPIEAQAYSLKSSLAKSSTMIMDSLRESVELLIKRISAMEVAHG